MLPVRFLLDFFCVLKGLSDDWLQSELFLYLIYAILFQQAPLLYLIFTSLSLKDTKLQLVLKSVLPKCLIELLYFKCAGI